MTDTKTFSHTTVPMDIHGQTAEIDAGIAVLVKVLNTVPGVETVTCCQGGSESFPDGYVMLQRTGEPGTKDYMVSLLRYMTELIDIAWDRYGRQMERHFKKHGKHPEYSEFSFSIELGNLYIMRWSPQIYPEVLKAAKKVAKGLVYEEQRRIQRTSRYLAASVGLSVRGAKS